MTFEEYQEMKKSFWAKFEAFKNESPDECDYALRRFYVNTEDDPDQGVRNTYESGKIKPDAYHFVLSYCDTKKALLSIIEKYRNTDGHDGAACALSDYSAAL